MSFLKGKTVTTYITHGFREEKPIKPIYLEIEKNLLASAEAMKTSWPEMSRFCLGYAKYFRDKGEKSRVQKIGYSRKQLKRMKRETARKARYEEMD